MKLSQDPINPIIDKLSQLYLKLDMNNVQRLSELYADEIEFIDPAHHVQGLQNLSQYFYNLIENLDYCSIELQETMQQQGEAFIIWTMSFKHPKLKRAKTITVKGVSHIKFGNKIYYHHDYFDLGAMLYEHLPLIGRLIIAIKRRLAQ